MGMAMSSGKRFMPETGSIERIVACIFILIRLSGHQLPLTQFLGFEEALLFLLLRQLLPPQLLVVAIFLQRALKVASRFRDILVRWSGHRF